MEEVIFGELHFRNLHIISLEGDEAPGRISELEIAAPKRAEFGHSRACAGVFLGQAVAQGLRGV